MQERSTKKTVALIIHKLTSGGAQKILSNLSGYLADEYDIHVIVFDGSTQTYETQGTLHDLRMPPAGSKASQALTFCRRLNAVKRIKKEIGADCSISFLDGPNLINYFSRSGDKTVLSVRSYLSKTAMPLYRRKYTTYIHNHADSTVVISDMVEKDLADHFAVRKDKLTTIYNACDVELIQKLAEEEPVYPFQREDGLFYFVTVGRLTKAKGHWHLLRAFKKLSEERPNARLLMVGTGELEEKTKGLVKELGLENVVTLTGFQNNPHAIVNRCDAFVFSSIYEGFGNAIVDALALSKPVVCSDCFTGPRNILAPDTPLDKQTDSIEYAKYGILVPVGNEEHFNTIDLLTSDEELLCKAMLEVMGNKELRDQYSRAAAERAADFSVKNTKKQWVDLIESLTGDLNGKH